jgi:cytochrome c oxidase assembly factor CtaG
VLFVLIVVLFPAQILAHDGISSHSGQPSEFMTAWNLDLIGIVLIFLSVFLYGWAYRRLRALSAGFIFSRWHPIAFTSGMFFLLIVLVSPIDTYSDDLFWVHMVQHMVIVMLVAPLILLGSPVTLFLRASNVRIRHQYLIPILRSRVIKIFMFPPIAISLFIASIWLWHIPALYELGINNEVVHFFEHASFLTGALVLWWLIIGVDATDLRPGHIARVAVLILVLLQNVALALILTSVDRPIYPTYEAVSLLREWGPTVMVDQRLGAGIMWVPGAMMFCLALLVVFYYWAEREDFNGRRADMLREMRSR